MQPNCVYVVPFEQWLADWISLVVKRESPVANNGDIWLNNDAQWGLGLISTCFEWAKKVSDHWWARVNEQLTRQHANRFTPIPCEQLWKDIHNKPIKKTNNVCFHSKVLKMYSNAVSFWTLWAWACLATGSLVFICCDCYTFSGCWHHHVCWLYPHVFVVESTDTFWPPFLAVLVGPPVGQFVLRLVCCFVPALPYCEHTRNILVSELKLETGWHNPGLLVQNWFLNSTMVVTAPFSSFWSRSRGWRKGNHHIVGGWRGEDRWWAPKIGAPGANWRPSWVDNAEQLVSSQLGPLGMLRDA